MSENQPIFRPLSADDPEPEATVIESLCMNCEENGTTRLLLTKIPFYKEVVLMSFFCDHCGFQNNEIQPGGRFEEKGVRIKWNVESIADLNRQVVKSDYTSIQFPALDFEIPSQSQKGEITTLEGIIDRSIEGLEQTESSLIESDPESAGKIKIFLSKLRDLKLCETSFVVLIEDVSGNSFVSNPNAPAKDPNVEMTQFVRNKEQNHMLGLYERQEIEDGNTDTTRDPGVMPNISKEDFTYEKLIGEVFQFPTNCYSCNSPCFTNMKMTNIPHFKEVVIMATNCDICGHRSNEIKSGGGVEPKAIRIEVRISKPEDLTRDILKSETCQLEIPEIELEVGSAALGGRFTTVEGLLTAMKDQLVESGSMFTDSQDDETKLRFGAFLKQIDEILGCNRPVTLVLDDPAGNSYVQKMCDEGEDPDLQIIQYDRSFEQNEDLGLNDIRTENYETNE